MCSRYNPCSLVTNCNSTANVALRVCQTRKGSSDYGALYKYVVGFHDSAYFDGRFSPSNGIDILYPYKNIGIGYLECTVHVKCDQSSIDTFEYLPNSEASGEVGSGSQSASFNLIIPLACPPQTFMPLWLIIVLSIVGLGMFCVCAGLIAILVLNI